MGLIWQNSTFDRRGRGFQRLEFVERAVEGAFEVGLLAGEAIETPGAAGVGLKDGGEALLGREAAVLLLQRRRERAQSLVEELRFVGAEEPDAPGGLGDLADEEGSGRAVGPEVVEEGGEGAVEFLLLIRREDKLLCVQAVLQGVEADGGLALRGSGAGALEGIAAIGIELFLGNHGSGSRGRTAEPRRLHCRLRRAAAEVRNWPSG